MRKPLLCLTASLFLLVACAGKKETPEQITLDFFDALYNEHDLEKAEAYCTEESKPNLRSTIRAIQGAMQIVDGSAQTHYDYTLVKDRCIITLDTATMTVSSSLDTTTMQIRLVKINGDWMVDFNYDANVMEKELIDEVLEEMEAVADTVIVEGN